jgi:hypothetical protein
MAFTIINSLCGGISMSVLTVGKAAQRIADETGVSVPPHLISTLFYKRLLNSEYCPVVGQIRLIPEDYLPTIVRVLQERGTLPASPEESPA